jgi:hypothetical protein
LSGTPHSRPTQTPPERSPPPVLGTESPFGKPDLLGRPAGAGRYAGHPLDGSVWAEQVVAPNAAASGRPRTVPSNSLLALVLVRLLREGRPRRTDFGIISITVGSLATSLSYEGSSVVTSKDHAQSCHRRVFGRGFWRRWRRSRHACNPTSARSGCGPSRSEREGTGPSQCSCAPDRGRDTQAARVSDLAGLRARAGACTVPGDDLPTPRRLAIKIPPPTPDPTDPGIASCRHWVIGARQNFTGFWTWTEEARYI